MELIVLTLALFLFFAALEVILLARPGRLRLLAILPALPVLYFGAVWWRGSLQSGLAGFGDGIAFLFLAVPAALGLCAGALLSIIRRCVKKFRRREMDET